MTFEQFLAEAKKPSFWQQRPVLCFHGPTYPILFFSTLFSFLERTSVLPYVLERVPYATQEPDSLIARLSQSFLGQQRFYFLGNCTSKADKKALSFFSFLSTYNGPHTVAFFLAGEGKEIPEKIAQQVKKLFVIDVSDRVDRRMFDQLNAFFDGTRATHLNGVIDRLFSISGQVELDVACMLFNYFDLISERQAPQFSQYLSHLVVPQRSLMRLSGAFFENDPHTFFSRWEAIRDEYSDMFWVIFWGEQLWQAHHVVACLQNKKFNDAKRIGYRLPFSFFRNGWRRYSLKELSRAHDFVYRIDYALKQGSSFCALELFYSHHFLRTFS